MRFIQSLLSRVYVLYILIYIVLFYCLDRNQIVDDILNTARPSADYVHLFSYDTKTFDKGEFKRARAYYQTLIKGKFRTSLMYANLGFCNFYLNDGSAAIDQYKLAIKLDERMYPHYFDLGYILLKRKDYQNAQDMFRKTLYLIPKDKNALINMLHINDKYRNQPMFDYYYAQRLPWDRLMTYIHLLTCLEQLHREKDALSVAIEAIQYYPEDPQLYFYASSAALKMGYLKESLAFVLKCIEIAPSYIKAYSLKVDILESLGKSDLARDDISILNQLKGKSAWTRKNEIPQLHHWDENILLFQIYR